jgi:HSP20 family protein
MVGKFERVLTINTPVDSNKIEADFENGILTLTLPKAEAAKPKQITVRAKTPVAQS